MPKQLIIAIFLLLNLSVAAQVDSTLTQLQSLPAKYLETVSAKADKYYKDVTSKTEKTLEKLVKWEEKIRSLLEKVSPETAVKLFSNSQITFATLLQKYKEGKVATDGYMASFDNYRDKLNSTLKYLDEKKQQLSTSVIQPLKDVKEKVQQLNEQLTNTEALEQLIKERKKLLMQQALQYLGKSKYLQKINKEAFYYFETLKNYKQIFSDPKRVEELAVRLLRKLPAFNEFLEKNSLLASLFGSPGAVGNPNGTVGLLQSRVSVFSGAQNQLQAGGISQQQMLQQVVQTAQGQLNQLRQQIAPWGGGSDFDIPDFKPNSQRSKKFLQRIELSADVQSTRHNSLFPLSSDIGFSMGYKPNDRLIAGIGGSYRVGWGTSLNDIRISHQGIGLRSFLDWKIKGVFFLTGGYEQNYFSEIRNLSQLRDYSEWKPSALLGLSKKYSIGKKRKGEMKVLYDFFSHTKTPRTSSILFRIGFGL